MNHSERYRQILDALEGAQAHQSLAGDATEAIQAGLRLCREGISAQALEEMRLGLALDGVEAGTATPILEGRFRGQAPRLWISGGYLVAYGEHGTRVAVGMELPGEVRRGMELLRCRDVEELDVLIEEVKRHG